MSNRAAFMEKSRELAQVLGQIPLDGTPASTLPDGADFIVYSRTRPGLGYPMVMTPDGYAVHQGEGCESESFNSPTKCWHSRSFTLAQTAVTPYQSQALSPRDFTREEVDVLKNTIAKGVSDAELALFVATCQRTGLDPFARQIYAVTRRSKEGDAWVNRMTIQVGIDGLRLIAERTAKYGGQDPIEWLDSDGAWSEVWTARGDHPVAARCSVYRKDWQGRKATAIARWDSYAQDSATWKKMPDVMLAKCAEALALRRAFPAEMSGVAAVIDEEFDQQAFNAELEQAAPVGVIEGEVIQPEPKAPPDKPQTPMQRFWAQVKEAGLDADTVGAESQLRYGNRQPSALTEQERDDLIAALSNGAQKPLV